MDEETGRRMNVDVEFDGIALAFGVRCVRTEQGIARPSVGKSRRKTDHGIEQSDEIGPCRQRVRRIRRRVEVLGMTRRERSRQMAAGRKADHRQLPRIDRVSAGVGADDAHRTLRILERHVRAIRPAFRRQAIEQDEGGNAQRIEPARL